MSRASGTANLPAFHLACIHTSSKGYRRKLNLVYLIECTHKVNVNVGLEYSFLFLFSLVSNMHKLRLLYAENKKLKPPKVFYDYSIGKKSIDISFKVTKTSVFADPDRSRNKSCFGLWMMDVVEFFGRIKGNPTYFEFQVSPFNQFFELEIIKPMARVNLNYKGNMIHKATISKDKKSWSATMKIPLSSLPSNKKVPENLIIEGNFFALLGKPFNRFFHSAFMPKSTRTPKFHKPKYFRPL